MRRRSTWLILLVAIPAAFQASCENRCSDCSTVTGASSAAPTGASQSTPADPLTLSCASQPAASDGDLEWALTLAGGGAPYTYTIDFGDGTAAASGTWSSTGVHRVVHAYDRSGSFPFSAQVRDASGRTQACGLVVSAPVRALELSCAANPRSGTAPLRVTFEAPPAGRRGCIGPCTVTWSFGDGSEAESGSAVHEYRPGAAAGSSTFEAVATLRDGQDREARCRVPVEVRTEAPTPGSTPLPNRPPSIDGLTASPASILAGQSSAITASVTDPDPGDTSTWSLTLSGSMNAGNLSPASGSGPIAATFSASGGASGTVTIQATAVDSHGAVTDRSVSVSVTAPPPPNRPPVITSLTAMPAVIFTQVGGFSTVRGTIEDPDNDPVTWTYTSCNAPTSGSGTTATTGMFVPPSPLSPGFICVFVLTARDPGGLTATRSVSVQVVPAP